MVQNVWDQGILLHSTKLAKATDFSQKIRMRSDIKAKQKVLNGTLHRNYKHIVSLKQAISKPDHSLIIAFIGTLQVRFKYVTNTLYIRSKTY